MSDAKQGDAKQAVAFIGTGIMGAPMAGHLIDAGYPVTVYNRTASKAQPLVDRGARRAESVAQAVRDADVVLTMVGYPSDVEELYLAKDGIIANARRGAYLVDMTTSSPELARELHAGAEIEDMHAFDAPVTGGENGAIAATLTFFCGASEEEVEPVSDVLRTMGSLVLTFGDAGKGQLAKLTNQVALAGCMLGMVEGLAFAKQGGLDLDKTLNALLTGTAASASLKTLGPKILRGDYTPGFQVRHYVKDLDLALHAAEDGELTLPLTDTAVQLYSMLSAIGGGRMGTQSLSLVYSDEQTSAEAGLDWSLLNLDEEGADEEPAGDEEPAAGRAAEAHAHGAHCAHCAPTGLEALAHGHDMPPAHAGAPAEAPEDGGRADGAAADPDPDAYVPYDEDRPVRDEYDPLQDGGPEGYGFELDRIRRQARPGADGR